MKIAFYCDYDRNIPDKIATLDEGNIGVGGTQFSFMLVVSSLQKKYMNEENQYILLSNKDFNIEPNILKYKNVGNITNALDWCEANKYKYLVIRANSINLLDIVRIRTSSTKIILWAHNCIGSRIEKILYEEENIKKLICVSEQQYLNMRYSKAFSKMCYINNCIGNNTINNTIKFKENVIYFGVPTPTTGLHNAIKIFHKLKKINTNAKLTIIGSLTIRNSDMKLGKLKITYKSYEEYIKKLIKKYDIENDVLFLGTLNATEVKALAKEGGVGIVNPSYCTVGETFCLSAVELESYGIPVVSRKRNDGLNTSVKNKYTGFLETTDKKIALRISELLSKKELYYKFSENAKQFSQNFKANIIVDRWYNILNNLEENSKIVKKDRNINLLKVKAVMKKMQNKILLIIYRKWMR